MRFRKALKKVFRKKSESCLVRKNLCAPEIKKTKEKMFSNISLLSWINSSENNDSQQKPKPIYNWRPDLHDLRDVKLLFPEKKISSNCDLRNKMPAVYNQGALGSCTANAIAAAYEYDQLKQHEIDVFVPSRLFIYWNERYMENSVKKDAGASIRDGIKSIAKQGVCPEKMWPYNVAKFTQKPSANCYEEAKKHTAIKYYSLEKNLDQMRACLDDGNPFVFGFSVYQSFESPKVAKTGIMTLPVPGDKLLGGHAVMAVGYDDVSQMFVVRNSWGEEWGDKGYFYMPYQYMTVAQGRLVNDFWVVQSVSQ